MHLIKDENGNLCPHTHEHGHGETHPHTHEENCEGCGHTHSHEGCDGCQEGTPEDKMTALLDYMLKHNEHHAAELDQVAEKLRASGRAEAAEQIKKAVDEFQKGNLYLGLALSMVKEG